MPVEVGGATASNAPNASGDENEEDFHEKKKREQAAAARAKVREWSMAMQQNDSEGNKFESECNRYILHTKAMVSSCR